MNLLNTKTLFSVAVAATLLLSACDVDDLKDLIETNVDVPVEKTITVDLSAEDDPSISYSGEFDTTADGVDVTDVEIKSLSYEINNYVAGDEAISVTGLSISFPDIPLTVVEGDLDLSIATNIGKNFPVNAANAQLDMIVAQIKTNPKLKVEVSGEVSGLPAKFDLTVKMVVKVTGTVE